MNLNYLSYFYNKTKIKESKFANFKINTIIQLIAFIALLVISAKKADLKINLNNLSVADKFMAIIIALFLSLFVFSIFNEIVHFILGSSHTINKTYTGIYTFYIIINTLIIMFILGFFLFICAYSLFFKESDISSQSEMIPLWVVFIGLIFNILCLFIKIILEIRKFIIYSKYYDNKIPGNKIYTSFTIRLFKRNIPSYIIFDNIYGLLVCLLFLIGIPAEMLAAIIFASLSTIYIKIVCAFIGIATFAIASLIFHKNILIKLENCEPEIVVFGVGIKMR